MEGGRGVDGTRVRWREEFREDEGGPPVSKDTKLGFTFTDLVQCFLSKNTAVKVLLLSVL